MLGKTQGSSKGSKKDADEEVSACIRTIADCSSKSTNFLSMAFIGFAGHGKSSFLNSVASYSCKPPKLKQLARAGHGENTVTTHITPHELVVWDATSGDNYSSKIMLIDTPGHFCKEIMLEDEKQEHNPARAQLMCEHIVQALIGDLNARRTTCVVIVVSASQVWKGAKESMSRMQLMRSGPLQIPNTSSIYKCLQTLRQVQNVAGHHSMRAVCILTHCDVVDKTIRKDARNVAQSSTVDRIRTYVALQLGLAPNLVHATVNLLHEPDPASDLEVGSVAMTAFKHALTAAEDGRNEIVTGYKQQLHKVPGDVELSVHPAGHDIRPFY